MARVKTFGKEYRYILAEDRALPKDEQTIWYYKVPSLQAQMEAKEDMEMEVLPGQDVKQIIRTKLNENRSLAIIRSCLVRIENLRDDSGNTVGWSNDKVEQDKVLALIASFRLELAQAFEKVINISEDERKN